MTLNREAFFKAVRASFGALNQSQVDGFKAILGRWEARGGGDDRHLAYMLATAWHETGRAMQPVAENLNYTSADRIRAVWPSRFPTVGSAAPYVRNPSGLANKVYGGRMGNTGPDDGWRFRGRGLPQITGKANYARAAAKLGLDLVGNPDLALRPDVAADIMFAGMLEGWFTGKRLSDYEGGGGEYDARNARRIINGLDAADKIAGYYRQFLRAVLASQVQEIPPPDVPAPKPPIPVVPVGAAPPDIEPIETTPAQPASSGLFHALKALLEALFGRKPT